MCNHGNLSQCHTPPSQSHFTAVVVWLGVDGVKSLLYLEIMKSVSITLLALFTATGLSAIIRPGQLEIKEIIKSWDYIFDN